jgi:hypothetical protein
MPVADLRKMLGIVQHGQVQKRQNPKSKADVCTHVLDIYSLQNYEFIVFCEYKMVRW